MARVTGVSDDLPCFPHTSLGVDVLEGGKLTSNDVLGRLNYSLQGFPVESDAVLVPGGDAASQDALHSATVELSKNVELRPNFFSRLRKKRRWWAFLTTVCLSSPVKCPQ